MTKTMAAALAYADRLGWPVFPCVGKVPAIKGGRGCLDATTDPETIQRWWREYPDANIGVACASSWVLDIDGDDGHDTLAELEHAHGELPVTPRQITGSGGEHILFRCSDGIRNRTRFAPGLDVRAAGGYIVVAPSIHPDTGRPYAWSVDGHPLETPLADAPAWLADLVTRSTPHDSPKTFAVPDVVAEGARNHTLARVTGHLLRRYVEPALAYGLIQTFNACRCIPPLPAAEVERTFASILAREIARREAKNG